MFKVFRQIFLLVLLLGVYAFAADPEGPESGGGGGIIFVGSQPQLVDFYTIQNSRNLLAEKFSAQKSSVVLKPVTASFEYNSQINDPAFATVLKIFSDWSNLPYDTIGLLINGSIYKPVVWSFTDELIAAPKFYRPMALPASLEIKTAAYYLQKGKTFHVSVLRPIWNQMQLQDQVGLLMHETLRHVQIGLSMDFDDEALQKATAMMMTCKPRVKYDQYLFFLLHNRRDLAEKNSESFDLLTKECWK